MSGECLANAHLNPLPLCMFSSFAHLIRHCTGWHRSAHIGIHSHGKLNKQFVIIAYTIDGKTYSLVAVKCCGAVVWHALHACRGGKVRANKLA